MLTLKIKPFDVLFFGSGKPFNIGSVVHSTFPPMPHTIAGAISAKFKYELKIDSSMIIKRIFGPFLFRAKNNKTETPEIFFPKPANILEEKKTTQHCQDNKSEQEINDYTLCCKPYPRNNFKLLDSTNTNLTNELSSFPILFGKYKAELSEGFISSAGLAKWLQGEVPPKREIIFSKDQNKIFEFDSRLGIKQDFDSGTVAEEDALYRINFLQLANDWESDWELITFVEFDFENSELTKSGLENENDVLEFLNSGIKVLKLGGEMRVANFTVGTENFANYFSRLELLLNFQVGDYVQILLLSPGIFDGFVPRNLGVEVISMATNGYSNVGIIKDKFYNKTMQKALKPGTVIFAKVIDESKLKNINLNPSTGENGFIGSNLMITGRFSYETIPHN